MSVVTAHVTVTGLEEGFARLERGVAEAGDAAATTALEARRLRAVVVLAGFLAERSQSPMSYSQMVSKAVALAEAVDREVR